MNSRIILLLVIISVIAYAQADDRRIRIRSRKLRALRVRRFVRRCYPVRRRIRTFRIKRRIPKSRIRRRIPKSRISRRIFRLNKNLKIWSIALLLRDEHGDEQQKKNAAAMTQFLDNLSDEAGQENARKFIKDVAKMIEDEENDVKLADQFDINEANSNQARNEEDQTKEEKTNEDTDAQANEDAELMELLRSLKENL